MPAENWIDYSEEVSDALAERKPLVALESTIITHGMPFPQNLKTALLVESIIREESVVPATIAIIEGKIKVGLTSKDLEQLASNQETVKVSRRDLSTILNRKQSGGTTVSATMICANKAGIRVFVTGGIGGVHKDYEQTLDVSADLEELSRTPVAVVCAGVKSILDIPKTLEYLETRGVPVIGFGCDEFPAFYTPLSGVKSPFRMNDAKETALCMKTHWDFGLEGGLLIANPIPEKEALDPDLLSRVMKEAIESAKNQSISGKDITPFVLEKIVQKTDGVSLKTNIALIQGNARVGARIAYAFQNNP